MLSKINEALDSNIYLTKDIKENIKELMAIFTSKFPNVDLSNFLEHVKTLKFEKGSKYLVKNLSEYNPLENKIYFCLSQLDDSDCKHLLMRELLNVITAKDNYTGFNVNNEYRALNIGYTEILANLLVGNESVYDYEDEMIAADLMVSLIGTENVFNAYFNNDINIILNAVG